MLVTRLLSRCIVLAAAAMAVLPLATGQARADAYDYSVVITNFTDGATFTISFNGTDSNGDGLLTGLYDPSSTTTSTLTQELTALSLSFSGNSVIPAFDLSTDDFTSTTATLTFPAGPTLSGSDSSYFVELAYVLDNTGTGVADAQLPGSAANGDTAVFIVGSAGENDVAVYGTNCGAFGGNNLFGPGTCAIAGYGTGSVSATDFAVYSVPEPASMALLGAGLGMLALRRRRA